jgi:hypothetical protein
MNFFDRIMNLDRRWIYLAVAMAVLIGFFIPTVPVTVTPEVTSIYDFVENTKPGEIIFLAIDYDPNAMAELQPMAIAIMRQCFAKNIKLIISALSQNGPGMAEDLISKISQEFTPPKRSGIDFTYLGYKPYYAITILGMGQNLRIPFPRDYYGVILDSLPMMQGVKNYDNVKCVLDLSAGNITDAWIQDAHGRYNVPLAIGVTGVMAADYYQYLQAGQIFGIMGGLKGAAEYEALANAKKRTAPWQTMTASEGMKIQTMAHIVVILFIFVGNLGFFMSKKRKNR